MSNLTPGILTTCRWCGHRQNVPIHPADYVAWHADGELIQDAAPYLTDAERELLISGTCGDCFDEMIATGEDMS